ncbi:MAG: peptide deformylase [Patescibacteria group bacterium]|nr:peptide deformylase [Patescibacteria group bacterium]
MLEIVKYPDPVLRQKSEEVKNPTDSKIKRLIADMTATLRAHEGLGLAAPQIGHSLQLCIIEVDDELFVLINPKVKNVSGEQVLMEEGCLSFPGKFLPIQRPKKIKIKALDANGKKQVIRAKGLLARVLQHEVDHLDGTLFIDRAKAENKVAV